MLPIPNELKKTLLGAAILALAAGGCASDQKRSGAEKSQENGQAKQQEQAGQVVEEETEVLGHEMPGSIGESTSTQSQATVPVRKRITRTVISKNQIPTVKICEERADVNRMDKDDFVAIGFSAQAADNIIQARTQRDGKLGSIQDLQQIAGVDPGLLQQLESELGFSTQQGGQPQAAKGSG